MPLITISPNHHHHLAVDRLPHQRPSVKMNPAPALLSPIGKSSSLPSSLGLPWPLYQRAMPPSLPIHMLPPSLLCPRFPQYWNLALLVPLLEEIGRVLSVGNGIGHVCWRWTMSVSPSLVTTVSSRRATLKHTSEVVD